MISKNFILRFNSYKEYMNNCSNNYGEYWTKEAPTFNVELTPEGYINKGERDYLPVVFSSQTNVQNLNDYKSPFSKFTNIQEKYLTLGSINFCTLSTSGNSTLRYAKYYDEIIDEKISKLQSNTVLEIGGVVEFFLH